MDPVVQYFPEDKLQDDGTFYPSYSSTGYQRTQEGDQFYKLANAQEGAATTEAELSAKIVGLVSTSAFHNDVGIKSIQFIYMTESQAVCDSFSETLFIESPPSNIKEQDLTWFHWGYIAALINLLLLLIAVISGCICCRKMKKTFRQLQQVRATNVIELSDLDDKKF